MKYTFRKINRKSLVWRKEIMGEGYNEWYYLDGHFKEGYQFALQICQRFEAGFPGFGHRDEETIKLPCVWLRITDPDGKMYAADEVYSLSEFEASTETTDITIGSNSLKLTKAKPDGLPDEYHVKSSMGNIGLDLTYKVVVTGLQFTDSLDGWTYYSSKTGKTFGWWPVVPKAKIEGTLTINGTKIKVHGDGYQDHQLGTYGLVDAQSRWFWGHAWVGDYTLVWSDCPSPSKHQYRHFTPFMMWYQDELIFCTYAFNCYPEKFELSPEIKRPCPIIQTLRASDGHVDITGQLGPGKIIEEMPYENTAWLPSTKENPAFYFRQYSDLALQISRWGEEKWVKGKAIHEFAYLHPWFPLTT